MVRWPSPFVGKFWSCLGRGYGRELELPANLIFVLVRLDGASVMSAEGLGKAERCTSPIEHSKVSLQGKHHSTSSIWVNTSKSMQIHANPINSLMGWPVSTCTAWFSQLPDPDHQQLSCACPSSLSWSDLSGDAGAVTWAVALMLNVALAASTWKEA